MSRKLGAALLTMLLAAVHDVGAQNMLAASLNSITSGTTPDSTPRRQQRTKPPRSAGLTADSMAVTGDSVGALAYLETVLKKNPKDATALNEKGKLAWSMARGTRRDWNQSKEAIELLIVADTALRMATVWAPDSARYWMDLTKFAMNSGNVFIRNRAQSYIDKALKLTEKSKDSIQLSEAVDLHGMMLFRRYEASANKGFRDDAAGELLVRGEIRKINDPGKARPWELKNPVDHIQQLIKFVTPPTGSSEYVPAFESLKRARLINPLNVQARSHYYMALAEKSQWDELLSDAGEAVKKAPWNFRAQLVVGLAQARLNRPTLAASAFDSAFAYMTPKDRESFTRVSRILPEEVADSSGTVRIDAGRYKSQSAEANATTTDLYWTLADPLLKTPVNENRVEFYARVAYADLRWSSEDLDMRGADTERGRIYVRFGPPDKQVLVTDGKMGEIAARKFQIWLYNFGQVFYFVVPPTFGTATLPDEDVDAVREIIEREPVRWDNVAATSSLDTMTVRQARFRVGRDSIDVVTAVAIPAARMLKGSEIGGALPFDISVREYDKRAQLTFADSMSSKLNADSIPDLINRSWIRHLGPGSKVMRIDAFQSDTRKAARALGLIDEVRPTGFGMSDILFGQGLLENPVDSKRWSDIKMTPSVGFFHLSDPVGLVWELYDFSANKDGQSKYKVDFDIQFVREPGMKEFLKVFTVKALGRITDAITNTPNGTESVAFSFDRTQKADAVLADYVTLAFANVQPGNYRMVMTVTDLNTGKATMKTTMIRFIP